MMLFGIDDRSECVSLQHPDVGFTQCALHGGGVRNDVNQALSCVETAPKIVVLPDDRDELAFAQLDLPCYFSMPCSGGTHVPRQFIAEGQAS
jgi:hypothetical protein